MAKLVRNITLCLMALAFCSASAFSAVAFAAEQPEQGAGFESLTGAVADQIASTAEESVAPPMEHAKKQVEKAAERAAVKDEALLRARQEGSATDYCLAVDISAKRTIVMKWNGKDWKVVKYWICSTGAPDMPTLTGVYEVGDRGYSFGDGYTCYYYTQYCGNYLFHSIKYEPGTFDVQDGRLGEDVSEGCVRLKLENAQWIYDNIPWSTRVIVYE